MKVTVKWIEPPTGKLLGSTMDYLRRVEVGLLAAAEYWGQHIQNQARINVPWQDRTGNARGGLFYAVDYPKFDRTLVGELEPDVPSIATQNDVTIESAKPGTFSIYLSHTMFYGRFLEFRNGGRYAIIMSTIESNLPMLEQLLQEAIDNPPGG